jgi:hypothetical protein
MYTVKPLSVVSEETAGVVEGGGDKCCNTTVAKSIKHVGNISKQQEMEIVDRDSENLIRSIHAHH